MEGGGGLFIISQYITAFFSEHCDFMHKIISATFSPKTYHYMKT